MMLLVALAGVAVLVWHHRQIAEAIENFRDNFRGGPRTPMHPSPTADGQLLRRRARRPA